MNNNYKIVFFDLDGTLLNEDKQVPQDTIQAIAELKANGIEPVIATGRAPYFLNRSPSCWTSNPSSV